MDTEKNKFYVTTPIYYVTAKPHLGHLYSTVIADVLARWNKLAGKKVFFLTGTDEFGQKIAQAAQKAGKEPQEFVDSFIKSYKDVWKEYNIDYNVFMRTTAPFHVKAVQEWITLLMEKGDIYKSFYKGWYCTHCETFVPEEVENQAPECPTCGRQTHWVSEEAYFFKLSAYQDKLLELYAKNPQFIIPKERAAEVINFVKSGLKDLSISRTTVKWGVPFPNDSAHVTYVWADALNNYITAIGWGQKDKQQEFNFWWPADVHVMGKDILRFHAIYWPAFLMASGLDLPKHLLVHGWFKVGGQKMSKSFGNVIDPVGLQKMYGADQVRYYLLRQLAITHDGEFSLEDLEQKISSELADDLGNLLNRMVTLASKYNRETVTAPTQWSAESQNLFASCKQIIHEYEKQIDACMFHIALSDLWKFINQVNSYFHAQEPWKLAGTDIKKFQEVISATSHSLYVIACLLWPIMPIKMELLLKSLGKELDLNGDIITLLKNFTWKESFALKKIDTLFQKPEIEKNEPQPQKTQEQALDEKTISIEEFAAVQLCVGTIMTCQAIEKSDKLYKLEVDFGTHGKRQILSGIRKYFSPEELIGKQALFVLNLKPRTMMGLQSHGMLLTASTKDEKLSLIVPPSPVENGTCLK